VEALQQAADAIESWGAYADEYFQYKWDLAGDIRNAREALPHAEAIAVREPAIQELIAAARHVQSAWGPARCPRLSAVLAALDPESEPS
jgi:hypothetical protein